MNVAAEKLNKCNDEKQRILEDKANQNREIKGLEDQISSLKADNAGIARA